MISFVIPAHNEGKNICTTLGAIHSSAQSVDYPYEIIVIDDASTDATAELARQNGATVISVQNRQIAATRNDGACAANGEWIIFVDADTTINEVVVRQIVDALENGAAGGGAMPNFGYKNISGSLMTLPLLIGCRLLNATGGALMFCTKDAFTATGGFKKIIHAAEDIFFCFSLKNQGRFVVIKEKVLTPPRNLTLAKIPNIILLLMCPLLVTQKWAVKGIWYDSSREEKQADRTAVLKKIAIFSVTLLVVLVYLDWPSAVWLQLKSTPIGDAKAYIYWIRRHIDFAIQIFAAGYFLQLLIRHKHWNEKIRAAIFVFLGSSAAYGLCNLLIDKWTKLLA